MNKQLMVFTDAYGENICIEGNNKPKPYFKTINEYIEDGWWIMNMQGTGMAGDTTRRGSFAFLLEKFIPK